MGMAWVFLALAIGFEIAGTSALKASHGFTRLWPTVFLIPAYVTSFAFLAIAVKTIPVSIAYAVWAAVGIAAIALIGIVVFGESMSAKKVVFLTITIIGVTGLCLVSENGG